MVNKNVQAIILAAGKSTRFNTGKSKLVERICGKEMVVHTTSLLEIMNIPTAIVVGHKKELVEEAVRKYHKKSTLFSFVHQKEQLGTGHALLCTKKTWKKDHILVMNGDTPLLTEELLQKLIDTHIETDSAMSFIVAHNVDPSVKGYGLVFYKDNKIKIIEEKHLEGKQRDDICLNAGIYILKRNFIEEYLEKLPQNKKSGEFYLTTLAEMASNDGLQVSVTDAPFDSVRGVNTLRELWVAEQIKRSHLIDHWMSHGVRFSVAQNIHIDEAVKIGRDVYIGNGVQLFGKTEIGDGTSISPFSVIKSAKIGKHCSIRPMSVIKKSTIGDHCKINSFVHIHEFSTIQSHCTIDSFTEIRNQTVTQKAVPESKKKDKTFMAAFKTSVDQGFTDSL